MILGTFGTVVSIWVTLKAPLSFVPLVQPEGRFHWITLRFDSALAPLGAEDLCDSFTWVTVHKAYVIYGQSAYKGIFMAILQTLPTGCLNSP